MSLTTMLTSLVFFPPSSVATHSTVQKGNVQFSAAPIISLRPRAATPRTIMAPARKKRTAANAEDGNGSTKRSRGGRSSGGLRESDKGNRDDEDATENMERELRELRSQVEKAQVEMKEKDARVKLLEDRNKGLQDTLNREGDEATTAGGRRWKSRMVVNEHPKVHAIVVRFAKDYLKVDKFPPEQFHIYSEKTNTICGQLIKRMGGFPEEENKLEYWNMVLDAWKYQLQMRRNTGLQRQKQAMVGKNVQVTERFLANVMFVVAGYHSTNALFLHQSGTGPIPRAPTTQTIG